MDDDPLFKQVVNREGKFGKEIHDVLQYTISSAGTDAKSVDQALKAISILFTAEAKYNQYNKPSLKQAEGVNYDLSNLIVNAENKLIEQEE